ncbi:hypothetical protein D3C87_1796380 [compost metagenome]
MFIACARCGYRGADVFNMRGSVADMGEVVETIESVIPEARGTITFAGPSLGLPEDYDATALEKVIGPLPRTPLREAVGETFRLFRSGIASGEIRDI